MKFQDSSFNGLKVTVGTKSVTHASLKHAPKAICPINFFKVGGIIKTYCIHAGKIFRLIPSYF